VAKPPLIYKRPSVTQAASSPSRTYPLCLSCFFALIHPITDYHREPDKNKQPLPRPRPGIRHHWNRQVPRKPAYFTMAKVSLNPHPKYVPEALKRNKGWLHQLISLLSMALVCYCYRALWVEVRIYFDIDLWRGRAAHPSKNRLALVPTTGTNMLCLI
jgi:hypothetical protein